MKKITGISIAVAALLATGVANASSVKDVNESETPKVQKVVEKGAVKDASSAAEKARNGSVKKSGEAKKEISQFEAYAKAERAMRLQRVFSTEASAHKGVKKASKEIMEAIGMTLEAAKAIKAGNADKALESLKTATIDFDKALKADPSLDIVPVAAQVSIKSFAGDSKIIAEALDKAGKLLKEKRTQDARDILIPLQDEMDFVTQYIPMKIYPEITKKAKKALEDGKKDEALMILAKGFGTFITLKEIIPIPLMLASDMVNEASSIDKNEKEQAVKLLEMAKEELKRAELLGYSSKHDEAYTSLKKQIEAIEDEIKGKNMVEKLYEKIKNSFKSLFEDVRKDRVEQK